MQASDGGTAPHADRHATRPHGLEPGDGQRGDTENTVRSSSQVRLRLPREPRSAGDARQLVRECLTGKISERAVERTILAASELVTNAFKYGKGSIELRLRKYDNVIRLEVIDEGAAGSLRPREPNGYAIDGWGLRIVEALSQQWGVFEGTTHVWVDLPVS